MNKLTVKTLGNKILIERNDTIIVASVSCIYGIGSAESYSSMKFEIKKIMNTTLTKLKNLLNFSIKEMIKFI